VQTHNFATSHHCLLWCFQNDVITNTSVKTIKIEPRFMDSECENLHCDVKAWNMTWLLTLHLMFSHHNTCTYVHKKGMWPWRNQQYVSFCVYSQCDIKHMMWHETSWCDIQTHNMMHKHMMWHTTRSGEWPICWNGQ
jgi:hypothetical protein